MLKAGLTEILLGRVNSRVRQEKEALTAAAYITDVPAYDEKSGTPSPRDCGRFCHT